jgi:hypothetical protein
MLLAGCLLALSLAGCGGDSLGCVPVTGTATFADGLKIDQYETKKLTLDPVDPSQGTRRATANIAPDGSFVMSTVKPDDGVVPGSYTVSSVFSQHYPPSPADLAAKWEFEPATVEVTSGMDPLSITIRKAKK